MATLPESCSPLPQLPFRRWLPPLPNNSNLFIFSVWYFNISTDNVVWSANRLHPVNGSAALVITATGQLRLNDGSGRNLWPFNNVTANSNSTQLILRDDGDLIYGTWESFQFPTNTILPNQTFNGTTIISNNGKYSFVNSVNLTFGTERYWWTDNPFKNFENTGQINRDNQNPIYPTDFNSTRLRKLVVDDDGNLKILSFDPNSPRWDMVWQAHVELCQIFHTCGPNSICMSSGSYNSTYCVCAPGFSPDPRGGARQGCNRKLNVSNKLKFLQLDFVNFRGGANQIFIQTPNISVCQANCLKNSSCVGYTFSFEGNDQCVLQLDMLSNGLWSPGMKTAAFVKVDNSETDQSNFTGMKYKLQTTCPVHISIRPPPDNKDKTTRNIWIIVSIFIAELISGAVFFLCILEEVYQIQRHGSHAWSRITTRRWTEAVQLRRAEDCHQRLLKSCWKRWIRRSLQRGIAGQTCYRREMLEKRLWRRWGLLGGSHHYRQNAPSQLAQIVGILRRKGSKNVSLRVHPQWISRQIPLRQIFVL
uniref:non-specific serine/threonine protein kinase n=1 Tax=Cucumis melo TaxID=3656 RepID=A0A9I9CKX4_CUCME